MCEWTALLVVAAVVAIAWCAWRAWHGAPPAPYAPPLAGVVHTATVLGARYDSDKSDTLMLVLKGAFIPVALGCRATIKIEMGDFLADHEWVVQRVIRGPAAIAGGTTTLYLTTPSPPNAIYETAASPLGTARLWC